MIKFIRSLYSLCRKRHSQQLSFIVDRTLSHLVVLFILLFAPGMVMASDCHQQTSSLSKSLGDITVTSDLAVGQYITDELKFSDNIYYAMCESTNTFEKTFSGGLNGTLSVAGVYNGRTTFNTNIPGVGIQFGGGFSVTSNQQHNTNYSLWLSNGATSATAFTISDIGWGEQFYIHYSPSFRLVKTANSIASGSLGGQVGKATASGNQGSASLTVSISGTVTVKDVPGCSVLTPATSVTLGNHMTSEFTGINSTTASVNVPVQLQCEAGVGILATLNATPDTTTTQPGAIKLTASSGLTADGVAVQMIDKQNKGIPLGSVTSLQTTTSGVVDFGWKARYLQTTSASVSVGDANASATVTIDYE